MKHSTSTVLAWSLFTAIAVMAGISLVYYYFISTAAGQGFYILGGNLLWGLLPVEFAFLAAMIISRQPRNLIGWLLLGPALALANDGSFNAYFGGFSAPPAAPSPGFLAALWFFSWSWLLLVFPVFLILQLFPSGRPLSGRWRWAAQYVLAVGIFFFCVIGFGQATAPNNLDWTIENPVGFIPADWIEQTGMLFIFIGLLSSTMLSTAALIVRYRRAVVLERAQIKWLLYACGIFALFYIPSIFGNLQTSDWGWGNGLLYLLAPLTFMAIPAAIGIAILRYRLWDIDIIIQKTLQYSLVTLLLGLVYLGGVTLLQSLFTALTGQESPAALVISTLGIAALFNPLRHSIQVFIDRRFYRNKYDAEKALAEFAAAASRETDLEQLSARLTGTVQETLQPEGVSLWLKSQGRKP
jgi:hypothetical protein